MDKEDLADKLEKRVRNWADSYEGGTNYTMGKKVGAMHAVRLLRQIQQEEDEEE